MSTANWKRVTLEMGLKSFPSMDIRDIDTTCRTVFTNWAKLTDQADEIAVMLWASDGTETLGWHGDMDEELEWSRYIGFCNVDTDTAFPDFVRHYQVNKAVPFKKDPPKIFFKDLKNIITRLKAVGTEMTGKKVIIGATIDPGPEFADSPFKFKEHPEVLAPGRDKQPEHMHFMTHQGVLNADTRIYGGFPDGIPADTSIGTFVGRQVAAASQALGYDFIWFSNGFAYTHFPWGWQGEAYDGKAFDAAAARVQMEKTNGFWRDFRKACPDVPVEVRGTNYHVGADLATDGCSHADIMKIGNIRRPPCNPPWGSRALGLEMHSYLTRIAKSPGERLTYRFYLNDLWFRANPWYDLYNRETFDIYVPMSAGRINETGGLDTPTDLNLLGIDNEMGEHKRDEANETIPHFLLAHEKRADKAGPVVLVYPFDEFDAILKNAPERLDQVFMYDWYLTQAINYGLPLNTVCNTEVFRKLAGKKKLSNYIVYMMPAPHADWGMDEIVLSHVKQGGQVLLYGSLQYCSDAIVNLLGVSRADALDGEFSIENRMMHDDFKKLPEVPVSQDAAMEALGNYGYTDTKQKADPANRKLRHRAVCSGGGLEAVVGDWNDAGVRMVAEQDGRKRAYAVTRKSGGTVSWIRGTVNIKAEKYSHEPIPDEPYEVLLPSDWPRYMLADFGVEIKQSRVSENIKPANVFIKRHRGSFTFVGHKPDTTARFFVRMPDGAPAYVNFETEIVDGFASEVFTKSFHNEVRAFVKMRDGVVKCQMLQPPIGCTHQMVLSNLVDADVTLYPDPASLENGTFDVQKQISDTESVPHEVDKKRGAVVVKNWTGSLYVIW